MAAAKSLVNEIIVVTVYVRGELPLEFRGVTETLWKEGMYGLAYDNGRKGYRVPISRLDHVDEEIVEE